MIMPSEESERVERVLRYNHSRALFVQRDYTIIVISKLKKTLMDF